METRSREIKARDNHHLSMRITPGHFATRHSH
ncbi:MAG: orotate phosphoribosyltransferase, partial [Ruminococcaceae bacterium]|nr:orotate phosphoribosyltransferase [Oscillospiraceae bacterium]